MSRKNKELPKPEKTPFSRRRPEDKGQDDLLMADQMAMAAAEGTLKEYLEHEIPEGEYAKKLAMMMMGMTGILPQEDASVKHQQQSPASKAADAEQPLPENSVPVVPEDVEDAVKTGDAETLKELLAREMQKRSSHPVAPDDQIQETDEKQSSPSMIDKELLDSVIRLAFDNNVSVDWLISRAMKLYLKEYQKTGRL